MKYNIKAIPQMYADVQFRSRLEATWAAFFDARGWKWEYEPFDLDGWIPDFKLCGDKGDLLVEVKPTDFRDEKFLRELGRKIAKATTEEVLILGERPCYDVESFGVTEGVIGTLICFDTDCPTVRCIFDPAILNKDMDISGYLGSYVRRLSCFYDGNNDPVEQRFVDTAWKIAKNKTQWEKN